MECLQLCNALQPNDAASSSMASGSCASNTGAAVQLEGELSMEDMYRIQELPADNLFYQSVHCLSLKVQVEKFCKNCIQFQHIICRNWTEGFSQSMSEFVWVSVLVFNSWHYDVQEMRIDNHVKVEMKIGNQRLIGCRCQW